eukprot:14409901-Alexandrium_andersonii.AAC.1
MSASLVGSEMCIRDRYQFCGRRPVLTSMAWKWPSWRARSSAGRRAASPVSYTHLTLPTICSV